MARRFDSVTMKTSKCTGRTRRESHCLQRRRLGRGLISRVAKWRMHLLILDLDGDAHIYIGVLRWYLLLPFLRVSLYIPAHPLRCPTHKAPK